MRNILLTVEYDGSRYHGFESQESSPIESTISGRLREVIKKMTGQEDIELHTGFRTEIGVHAYAQTVNFKTASDLSPEDMKHYMNKFLPMDIAIIDAKDVPERFHSKLNAQSKTFLFHMFIGREPNVFDRKHSSYSAQMIHKNLIREAAKAFVGIHDFKYFSNTKSNKSTIKEIYDINVYGDENGDEIFITISANDFLYNMVPIILGTMLDVGCGNRPIFDIPLIFAGKEKASPPCDTKGLFLQQITY